MRIRYVRTIENIFKNINNVQSCILHLLMIIVNEKKNLKRFVL